MDQMEEEKEGIGDNSGPKEEGEVINMGSKVVARATHTSKTDEGAEKGRQDQKNKKNKHNTKQ